MMEGVSRWGPEPEKECASACPGVTCVKKKYSSFRGLRTDFQSYFQSSWPGEVPGDRVKGRVVVEPAVVSVCTRCIFAALPGLALPPLSPGLLGSFAAQGWKMRATVEEGVKKRRCWESRKVTCAFCILFLRK